ncbi:glycosyltransferase family 1 protein [Sphingomonas parva]|uniref:Glycosyltransferase family 1 protein n=1 Tax=Sphingomonas parva TaxID=2555898 RepID=A0A4Y8ZWR0_9SPHN|nr:glycosyltransferase family 4 protein [Sphingomonas parva]TFI59907.1 glycosyltransferase family 1 protein [Sphingomonas parva]
MTQKTVLISINAAWNIVNFRGALIRGLLDDGYRLLALAPPDAYAHRLAEMGVEYHPIAMDKKGISPTRDLALLARYRAELKRLRPDVFLGFTAKPNVYGSLAAQSLGIRVINNVSGLGTAFIRKTWLTSVVSALYRLAFRRSSTVFFQNEEDLSLFLEERIVSPGKAMLLPGSGVDLARFSPQVPAARGRPSFLLVARLLRDKGVVEFVEAARTLRGELPDWRFQLLGFLDAENRTAVSRAEVTAWQEEGVIDYLEHADDVRPFLAAAESVVLPSYREGMPRSLLEAAAMGKPLIATDVPGCRHVVDDGVNGFLCAPEDAASLAAAMRKMAGLSAAERARLGKAARAKAEVEFDERKVVQLYRAAISAAVNS